VTRFAGYAALFDRADRSGDVIRSGAFGPRPRPVALCWEHGAVAGTIEALGENAIGLWVTGICDRPVWPGLGLSIGFRVQAARRLAIGRELIALELVEVSLVRLPMQPLARVARVAADPRLTPPPTPEAPTARRVEWTR
jgi:phage head maturation protease